MDLDDTSGPDQSSPAYADSEATPDPPRASSPSKFQRPALRFQGNKIDEGSGKTNPLNKAGRGEIPRRNGYTDMLHRKVDKRRRRITDRDVQNAPRRYKNDSDTEERPSSSDNTARHPQRDRKRPAQGMGFIPSVLTFIDAHPTLPNTLSYYVQFFLNCFFAGCLMYVLYGVFSTIRHDIDERAMIESSEILAEMAVCAREFKENRCERDTRVPAMESVCNGWEKCMARDPYKVGRSRLSAGMFAEIFNSFVEPISIKALVSRSTASLFAKTGADTSNQVVSVSVIVGCFAVNNLTFGIYRSKHPTTSAAMPSQPAYMAHQQQPQLGHASPGYGHLQSPYQYQIGEFPQQDQMNWQPERSPSKRLEYR